MGEERTNHGPAALVVRHQLCHLDCPRRNGDGAEKQSGVLFIPSHVLYSLHPFVFLRVFHLRFVNFNPATDWD